MSLYKTKVNWKRLITAISDICQLRLKTDVEPKIKKTKKTRQGVRNYGMAWRYSPIRTRPAKINFAFFSPNRRDQKRHRLFPLFFRPSTRREEKNITRPGIVIIISIIIFFFFSFFSFSFFSCFSLSLCLPHSTPARLRVSNSARFSVLDRLLLISSSRPPVFDISDIPARLCFSLFSLFFFLFVFSSDCHQRRPVHAPSTPRHPAIPLSPTTHTYSHQLHPTLSDRFDGPPLRQYHPSGILLYSLLTRLPAMASHSSMLALFGIDTKHKIPARNGPTSIDVVPISPDPEKTPSLLIQSTSSKGSSIPTPLDYESDQEEQRLSQKTSSASSVEEDEPVGDAKSPPAPKQPIYNDDEDIKLDHHPTKRRPGGPLATLLTPDLQVPGRRKSSRISAYSAHLPPKERPPPKKNTQYNRKVQGKVALQGSILTDSVDRRKAYLVANKDHFLPLLPRHNNLIRYLQAEAKAQVHPYVELDQQPEGCVLYLSPLFSIKMLTNRPLPESAQP